MRLWSLHPKYLDQKGLGALWREGLLAQSCLIKGARSYCKNCITFNGYGELIVTRQYCDKCKNVRHIKTAYYNHSQLDRFKNCSFPLRAIGYYLTVIWEESRKRKYKFDASKINYFYCFHLDNLTVTKGQLEYEMKHLCLKLGVRDKNKAKENNHSIITSNGLKIEPHPLFKVVEGKVESWEKVKERYHENYTR